MADPLTGPDAYAGTSLPGRVPGITYIIDTSRSVQEPPRQGSNGHGTRYAMALCPICHRQGPQERGAWERDALGQWTEKRTCKIQGCPSRETAYTVPLLPFEVEQAERLLFA